MQWSDFVGHQQQYEWFRTALAGNRLATSFLFVGPEGVGKRTFARLLAKSLLCNATEPQQLSPCGVCEDCAQVDASTHPDLIQISKPAEKAYLPIELLIGEREKRMREGLCHDISMRPYGGRRKIAILDDADTLNVEGANCLLKTLEEPPLDSIIILVGAGLQRQLPTIRSRCQAIVFRPLDQPQLESLILRQGIAESEDVAREIAQQAEGSLTEARLLADEELKEFRGSLLNLLSQARLALAEISKHCGAMADAAGKDARLKRDRLKLIFRMAASLYRGVAYSFSALESQAAHTPSVGDPLLSRAVQEAMHNWKGGAAAAIACWQRCLTAIEQVDRNANQASLLEAWITDVAAHSQR
ncbi:DNA polymerase III subunit [Aureliella helgolandensis]|uniref:DNA polymerase III subunit tau n=1 Tax=Aureliella helgolandensis TaxID=2527968 RepID=A0A518GCM7_9BACT|nr:AAA family ATPase [Aureliella helgolandensis]QDV26323.1 DNA polymerase III subunit tau [Aureliella helgolandensis]